ncbi:hypothetical protein ABK905_08190 [Acerihabitans sp. KWT182]|uniref:Uncharacterized protein n=1 Tax=Acerihabitans sp. KWT182 TaxID=3157919 RepID=A0AAU7QCX0_9GAMM
MKKAMTSRQTYAELSDGMTVAGTALIAEKPEALPERDERYGLMARGPTTIPIRTTPLDCKMIPYCRAILLTPIWSPA